MAKTIYDYWFVQFDFPNENGKPYKSSGGKMVNANGHIIPEGWTFCKVQDIISNICTSPKLIAAYHVLHRLREPRHPPCALFYFLYSFTHTTVLAFRW